MKILSFKNPFSNFLKWTISHKQIFSFLTGKVSHPQFLHIIRNIIKKSVQPNLYYKYISNNSYKQISMIKLLHDTIIPQSWDPIKSFRNKKKKINISKKLHGCIWVEYNGVDVYRVGSASDPGASKPERSGGLRVHIYNNRPLSKFPKHGSNW